MFSKFTIPLNRSAFLLLFLAVSVFFLNRCSNEPVADERGFAAEGTPAASLKITFGQFAGSASCAGCHKDVYEKHLKTAHHLTSQPASGQTILGSFKQGQNTFGFNPANKVVMEKKDSSFYQVHYRNGEVAANGRFDVVVGSGRKGQSYLSWLQNHFLVQMPITYFSPAGQWSNSPGYPPTEVVFNRPITSRCMECHSTFASTEIDASGRREQFDRKRLILGVECEKCHGPAAQHVAFQTSNPQIKEAKFIVHPGKLTRDRQLDLCALCHGGQLKKTKPSFQFTAGDTLTNFFSVRNTIFDAGNIDVHGNQHGLLSLSKCFTASQMTCTSCHNIHENEFNKIEVFSRRCQSCHSVKHEKVCKMTATLGSSITKNCIDCHMPKQPSHAVAVFLEGANSPTPALMRTHYIKVYPEEVKKVSDWLRKQKTN